MFVSMIPALKVWVLSLASVFSFTVQWSVNPQRDASYERVQTYLSAWALKVTKTGSCNTLECESSQDRT